MEYWNSYHWKTFQWEVCNKPYPYVFKYEECYYDLIDIKIPNWPFVMLESMANERNSSRFVFLVKVPDFRTTFSENPNLKRKFSIGRGHESDLRIWDISVSRSHTDIEFEDGVFKIKDKLSKFGTLVKVKGKFIISNIFLGEWL